MGQADPSGTIGSGMAPAGVVHQMIAAERDLATFAAGPLERQLRPQAHLVLVL